MYVPSAQISITARPKDRAVNPLCGFTWRFGESVSNRFVAFPDENANIEGKGMRANGKRKRERTEEKLYPSGDAYI